MAATRRGSPSSILRARCDSSGAFARGPVGIGECTFEESSAPVVANQIVIEVDSKEGTGYFLM